MICLASVIPILFISIFLSGAAVVHQVNEIAFINTLEAQNKKIEVLERHMVSEHIP